MMGVHGWQLVHAAAVFSFWPLILPVSTTEVNPKYQQVEPLEMLVTTTPPPTGNTRPDLLLYRLGVAAKDELWQSNQQWVFGLSAFVIGVLMMQNGEKSCGLLVLGLVFLVAYVNGSSDAANLLAIGSNAATYAGVGFGALVTYAAWLGFEGTSVLMAIILGAVFAWTVQQHLLNFGITYIKDEWAALALYAVFVCLAVTAIRKKKYDTAMHKLMSILGALLAVSSLMWGVTALLLGLSIPGLTPVGGPWIAFTGFLCTGGPHDVGPFAGKVFTVGPMTLTVDRSMGLSIILLVFIVGSILRIRKIRKQATQAPPLNPPAGDGARRSSAKIIRTTNDIESPLTEPLLSQEGTTKIEPLLGFHQRLQEERQRLDQSKSDLDKANLEFLKEKLNFEGEKQKIAAMKEKFNFEEKRRLEMDRRSIEESIKREHLKEKEIIEREKPQIATEKQIIHDDQQHRETEWSLTAAESEKMKECKLFEAEEHTVEEEAKSTWCPTIVGGTQSEQAVEAEKEDSCLQLTRDEIRNDVSQRNTEGEDASAHPRKPSFEEQEDEIKKEGSCQQPLHADTKEEDKRNQPEETSLEQGAREEGNVRENDEIRKAVSETRYRSVATDTLPEQRNTPSVDVADPSKTDQPASGQRPTATSGYLPTQRSQASAQELSLAALANPDTSGAVCTVPRRFPPTSNLHADTDAALIKSPRIGWDRSQSLAQPEQSGSVHGGVPPSTRPPEPAGTSFYTSKFCQQLS